MQRKPQRGDELPESNEGTQDRQSAEEGAKKHGLLSLVRPPDGKPGDWKAGVNQ